VRCSICERRVWAKLYKDRQAADEPRRVERDFEAEQQSGG
jgi:hypothetical protein